MCVQFTLFACYIFRKKNLISKYFALIFVLAGSGVIFNFIYLFMPTLLLLLFFYRVTTWCLLLSPVMNSLFVLSLYRSLKLQKRIDHIYKSDVLLVIIFSIIIWTGFLLPNSMGFQLPGNIPIFSLFLYVWLLIIVAILLIFSTIISAKIYKVIEQPDINKKWLFYIIGSILIHLILVGSIITNFLNVELIRTIWYLIMFPIAIFGSSLVYYGGIKHL